MSYQKLSLVSVFVMACGATREAGPVGQGPEPAADAYASIAAALDDVWVIDGHTHITQDGELDRQYDRMMPLGLRSTAPGLREVLTDVYGAPADASYPDAVTIAAAERERRLAAGYEAFWNAHLDSVKVERVVVDGWERPEPHPRMSWVPRATALLFPVSTEKFVLEANPHAKQWLGIILGVQQKLRERLGVADGGGGSLDEYMTFVGRGLDAWKADGAIAVKFADAYYRTLRFDEVEVETARALFERGLEQPLSYDDYIVLQNYVARRIFEMAGERDLVVHIHSGSGMPPFLRLHNADVRHLEVVLTDPRFFDTQFVLIHGGMPLIDEASYIAQKPHVWIDVSAQTFVYSEPDLADNLRTYLFRSPESILFGTDVMGYPSVPVGPEVQHVVLTAKLRRALYRALASLVEDGTLDLETALELGRGVLRGNAERLYGFSERR
jgi:predicted TIM-barrel fold metal-dependent hydrolase